MERTSASTNLPACGAPSERRDRHDPASAMDYLSIQHRERYSFAAHHLRAGMRVLDIACGTGYGARMLRNLGCDVVAGDIDSVALASASRQAPDIGFVCLDVLGLPFKNGCFDAVVSFETIEHVTDGEGFLDEIHRVLRHGGLFICSTPNIAYTAHPDYHVREYNPSTFFSLVHERFSNAERFGQYFRLADRLLDRVFWFGGSGGWRKLIVLPLRAVRFALRRLRQLSPLSVRVPRGADRYSVQPYRGDHLLRIMVTVSVK